MDMIELGLFICYNDFFGINVDMSLVKCLVSVNLWNSWIFIKKLKDILI